MKSTEHQLNRLLKAASQAPDPVCLIPSREWTRQALSACRTQRAHLNQQLNDVVLKCSLAAACVITALSLAWHYSSTSYQMPEAVSVANSGIEISFAP